MAASIRERSERFGQRRVALAAVASAVLAASTSAILIRAGDAPEPVMAFYRVTFTTLLLMPLARGARADLSRASGRDLLAAVVAGLALAVHFGTWFESVDQTTIAAVGLLASLLAQGESLVGEPIGSAILTALAYRR